MTTEKFKQLEVLLGELQNHLGYNYCIVPNHVQDGYYIALYDHRGDRFAEAGWVTLEEAAKLAIYKSKKGNITS